MAMIPSPAKPVSSSPSQAWATGVITAKSQNSAHPAVAALNLLHLEQSFLIFMTVQSYNTGV
jgi:hypothetical protein